MLRTRLTTLVFLGALLMVSPVLAAEVTLATHDLCPYGCYDNARNFDGIAIRVVRYAFDQMKLPLKIVVVPWERAQKMAWDGEVQGFFAASQNAKRNEKGTMSAVIAEQKWNWYLRADSRLDPQDKNFKTVARVASFQGANMLIWLEEHGYNVTAKPSDTECLVRMLLARRVDAILANNLVMENIITRDSLQGRFKITTLKEKPLGVYFTNRFLEYQPDFLDRFNEHVEQYRRLHP